MEVVAAEMARGRPGGFEMSGGRMHGSIQTDTLADILERVLDKGVVIAGDVTVSLVGVELLNIKLRLLIASVDKAMEMGINWWAHDPYLSVGSQGAGEQNAALTARIDRLEAALASTSAETLPGEKEREAVRSRKQRK